MGTTVGPDADSRTGGSPESPAPAARTPEPPAAELPAPAEDPVEEGSPAWMMTFGDMMSLLLTFFILLFSMSELETEKFRLAAASMQEGFGTSTGQLLPGEPPEGTREPDTTLITSPLAEETDATLDSIAERLEEFVAKNGLEEQVVVAREESGVYLRIQDVAVFPSGSARIAEESMNIIQQLGDIVRATDVPVVVSGHTDNTPIRAGGKFDTNWELSAARAAGVARALVDRGHDPTTIAVEAYGEYRPIDTNDTPEGRSHNRRVEIFYSREKIEEANRAGAARKAPNPPDPEPNPGP